MNFQQLEHFIALAETGSFSRASDKVHVTQSALSRSIQMLEQELGLPLVDRVGKRNELTPFGLTVLGRAKHIVTEIDELKRSAQLTGAGVAGTVRLGVGAAPGALFSGPLLVHMLKTCPQVRTQLFGGSPDVQLAALRTRHVDALLMAYRAVPPGEDLDMDVLPTLRSGFLCRKDHPLASRARVRFPDLDRYPLILTAVSDDVARSLIERHGNRANPQRWVQASSEDVSGIMEAVMATDAVFLGVIAVARAHLQRGDLVEVALSPATPLESKFAFVTLKGRTQAPALQVVRGFCASLAAGEVEAGR